MALNHKGCVMTRKLNQLVLSCSCFILTCCFLSPPTNAGIAGDMNCDQHRDGLDIASLVQVLLVGPEGECSPTNGDLNADGLVDLSDVEMFTALLMSQSQGPETMTGSVTVDEDAEIVIALDGIYSD